MATRTLWNESQFQAPPATVEAYLQNNDGSWTRKDAPAGVTIFDGCGVNAYAMAASFVAQTYYSTMHMFAMMAPRKLCDRTGRATPASIRAMALLDGFPVPNDGYIGWTGSGIPEATWRTFLANHTARGAVVIVETLEGCQLRDFISGQTEDAQLTGPNRLQRHFFGVYAANTATSLPLFPGVNNLPHGYVCADGCSGAMNPVVHGARQRLSGHQMVYYPYNLVRDSRPAALLAIYPKPAASVAASPAPQPPVATTATTTTNVTLTLSSSELQALESLLARLPKNP